MKLLRTLTISLSLILWSLALSAQQSTKQLIRETDPAFFKTDEARRIGDQVLLYQRVTGGWPKNIDMTRRLDDKEMARVLSDKSLRSDSTIDNDATTLQMKFLARLFGATGDERYAEGFRRGVEYLLSGQYDNGGWPQFWPEMRDYQIHITFNDDAIVNTLELFREIILQKSPFEGTLTDATLRDRLQKSFDKGIEIILATQIRYKGELTVWCQQHDRETLAPAPARAYELPSFCTQESAAIVRLLMSLPNPDKRVKASVHAAMRWFDTYKLTGLRLQRQWESPTHQTRLIEEPEGAPIWARFYDLERCEPYVCDRDGIPRRHLEQIGAERRNGYSWYNTRPADLYPLYESWAEANDSKHKVKISLQSKGANETGLIDMYRKPVVDPSKFDVVVSPGEKIQDAISKAPLDSDEDFTILILKGTYNEKVVIDRPHIVLVGEDREQTRIIHAETSATQTLREYNGKPVGMGVIVLQEGADDCVITGLTVYNNYGSTVEQTTVHQMSIFGRATRTIVINCNVWADGNDALALWATGGDGMYYHADLDLRCPGVDFLCPRGWCYATRCKFYGDSRAMIWHDGRNDKREKLVITQSSFDAASPTMLGRYHHDSQFILVGCTLSANVLDTNISYAYSDKVLDPCHWGQRTFYSRCTREGGSAEWLRDNLDKAPGAPEFYAVTALWTFDGRWDPEQRVRDLWDVVAY